jgi:aerobic carbon-monoxide dehydrogenase medium subunit
MNYEAPTTVDEALGLLAEHGDAAKVLAGGQSLLIMIREGLVHADALIGLRGVDELRELETNGSARIGAMVTHARVEHDPAIGRSWPLVATAEAAVSTTQIRNRGTLCGSVAHAFPTADVPAALVASDASVELRSRSGGTREVPADEFFLGMFRTKAGPEDLVTAVTLPAQPDGARTAYVKYALRPLDFAIVGVAVRVVLADDGSIADARIALNGAASRTLRATDAEQVLTGEQPSAELFARAGAAAAKQSQPVADIDGSAEYKRRVCGVYTTRALARALL